MSLSDRVDASAHLLSEGGSGAQSAIRVNRKGRDAAAVVICDEGETSGVVQAEIAGSIAPHCLAVDKPHRAAPGVQTVGADA